MPARGPAGPRVLHRSAGHLEPRAKGSRSGRAERSSGRGRGRARALSEPPAGLATMRGATWITLCRADLARIGRAGRQAPDPTRVEESDRDQPSLIVTVLV